MKSIRTTLLAIVVLTGIPVAGVDFSVSPDRTQVAVGEQIVVTAKALATKSLRNLTPPPLPSSEDFTVLRTSQNQSQSSSIQIINGKMEQKQEITYLFYYFIVPRKEGTFSFPSLVLQADGQSYSSQPFQITVTKAPVVNPNMHVSLRLSKSQLYVGEQAVLVFEDKYISPPDTFGYLLIIVSSTWFKLEKLTPNFPKI